MHTDSVVKAALDAGKAFETLLPRNMHADLWPTSATSWLEIVAMDVAAQHAYRLYRKLQFSRPGGVQRTRGATRDDFPEFNNHPAQPGNLLFTDLSKAKIQD